MGGLWFHSRSLNASLPFHNKDDALADVGGMIADSFELVRNPEQVCCPLKDEGVVLQGWNSPRASQHGHQVMAHQVIAHVDNVIFCPDGSCSPRVPVGKGLHRFLQDASCLPAKFEQAV